jgi:peptidyl-dipeptidase Dcp
MERRTRVVTEEQPTRLSPTATAPNPLIDDWSGPFGGVPPFDRVRVEHFVPALDFAIAQVTGEVERIAADPSPPTFQNTLEALERSGRALQRVKAVARVWRTTMSTPEFRAIEGELMTKMTRLDDRVRQDAALFRRIDQVYQARESLQLTAEQARLAWHYHTEFTRAGAALPEAAKRRLAEINERLTELSTRFDQNLLADESAHFVALESESDLVGLPAADREAAAAAAELRGMPGRWVIANTRSAVEPFLAHARSRPLRERVWRMFVNRGNTRGAHDNQPVIGEMLELRAERARLLGYPSHAHWAVENTMAKTPARALDLMEAVWPKAVAGVRAELEQMRRVASAERGEGGIEPWDYRFYADKVRAENHRLDWHELEPYLQLEKLREGMFWVAEHLFGMRFRPVDVPVYHADVRVWEVTDVAGGSHVGLFYFDPYARPGKKSGAWMNHYRRQQRLDGPVTPIVSNNCPFLRGRAQEPVLISWTDAVTLFHEFGHALHGLSSSVTYPSLSGTQVSPDYVEFASQILEFWLSTPEVLSRFALHHRTGEPMPDPLMERIEQAARAGEGFSTTEQLASALVDMKLHMEPGHASNAAGLEQETLKSYGMPAELVLRHGLPHFAHIFSGDQYAAKYYSYLWADVLAADAREAFLEQGGMFSRKVAARLRETLLSKGNTVDPEEAYLAFRGRAPRVEALLEHRGFVA